MALCLLVVIGRSLHSSFVFSAFAGRGLSGISVLSFFLLVFTLVLEQAIGVKIRERLSSAGFSLDPLFPTASIFRAVCVGAKILKLLVFLIFVLQGQCFRRLDCCPSIDGFFQKLQGPCGSAENVSNVPEASDFRVDLIRLSVEDVPVLVKGYSYASGTGHVCRKTWSFGDCN